MSDQPKTKARNVPPRSPGRPKGVPNRATTEFRDTIRRLLESNAENVSKWVAQVAAEDPDKALRHIAALAEYAAPKLNRTEVTGSDGGPVNITINKVA